MKKLLSICFLSMLLVLAGFTAKAQVTTDCCFWLENLQPETLHNIANIPGGGAAALPGTGGDVVLNNTMNRVLVGNYAQTDYYLVHFSNTCNLPANTKVSLEWKLYRNGQLVNGNLSDYADFRIYTRYNRLNNLTDPMDPLASCGHMSWIGGPVSGPGVCTDYQNYCVGGYPGAMQVETQMPYATNSVEAAGYINPAALGIANGYALDYFNLPFFEATDHVVVINWKQVGNYSLVVGVRERTGGTDWPSLYWSNQEGMQNTALGAIGGHQSCCGDLLAQDSIHYLVTSSSQKAVCDGETYEYGEPIATFSEEGQYLVIFGENTCDHFRVDRLDTLNFYTRINPNIVATDVELCHNEPFTAQDLAAHAPAVDTDAPGILGYQVMWSTNGTTWSETVPTPSTATPGTYTYYVQQTNDYDAVTGDEFSCTGDVATLTMVVKPLLNPTVRQNLYEFCNEDLEDNSPLVMHAALNRNDDCATEIRWYRNNTLVYTGADYSVDLTALNPNNVEATVVYTVVAASQYAESPRATAPTVTIEFHKTPVITANRTQDLFILCPGAPATLNSNFTCTTPANTTLSYTWKKNGNKLSATTANLSVNAPVACSDTDTYVVTVLATSPDGCTAVDTRTFTVISKDDRAITLTAKSSTRTAFTVYGCDTNAVSVPRPLTLDGLTALVNITDNCSNLERIVYTPEIVTSTPCTTVLKRSYYVVDACGNTSNEFVQTYTIVNNNKPQVSQGDLALDAIPVMDCKFDAPSYEALRAAFDANFRVNYVCDSFANHTVTFYFNGTNVVVDGNHDIFATTDTRLVDVVVTDPCGNTSAPTHVFTFYRPQRMDITDGSIVRLPDEICLHDTVFLNFDMTHVINATAPYTFEWKAEPNDGSIIHYTNPVAEGVPATANIDYIYRMVVTDRYGCKDSAYAEPVHVYGLPTVSIVPDIRNGAEFPLCPTYGVLTVEAIAESGVPGEGISKPYAWSGESVNVYSTNDTTGVYIIPDSCEHTYVVNVAIENNHGCPATAEFQFDVIDSIAPFFVTDNLITDSLVEVHENCVMYVPNFIPFFTNDNVKDNCYTLGQMTITQSPVASSIIHGDTPVYITVTDGCGNVSAPYTIMAKSANPIAVEISTNDDNICQGARVTLTATVSNAIQPYTFNWSDRTTNMTTTVIPTEDAHVYAVTVTDAMGCQAQDDIDITVYHVPTARDITLNSTPNTYCDNEDGIYDGTISVASFNHPDIVAYKMSTDAVWHDASYVYTGLYQGTYHFDLKTVHDCYAYVIAQIAVEKDTNVVIPVTTTTDNAWCVEPFDGSITVTNPQAGYTYEIINLPNSARYYTVGDLIYENLEYGHYSIHVTTDKYCSYVKEDIFVNNTRVFPTFDYTTTPQTSCATPNGQIIVTDPVEGYQYIFNNVAYTGSAIAFTGLDHGTYSVAVVSDKGCRKDFYNIQVGSTTVNPEDPHAVIANNTVCDPDITPNGSITIDAANTVAGFTYTLNDETVVADGINPIVFANLGANAEPENYVLTIVSTLGCSSTFTYTVYNVPFVVKFNHEISHIDRTNCDDLNPNGSITINPVHGYRYNVYAANANGVYTHPLASTASLPNGSYMIEKIDALTGCVADTIVKIEFNRPEYNISTSIVRDSDCSHAGNGSITVENAAGYTFFLNGSDEANTTGVFANLNGPAVYTILAVNNATTCDYETEVDLDSVVATPVITVDATAANYFCNDNKNGAIELTSSIANVTFFVTGPDNYSESNTTGLFEGLNSGEYVYRAVSALNCPSEQNVVMVADSAFIDSLNMHVIGNSMCVPTFEHPGNGQIIVDYPRGTQYDYSFFDAQGNEIEVGYMQPISYIMYHLATGEYKVVVTDTVRGCDKVGYIYVPERRDNVEIATSVVANVNCVAPYSGSITITATSDNVDSYYRYRINSEDAFVSNNVFANLNSGIYVVEVQDTATGCIYTKEVEIANNNIYAPQVTISEDSVFCLGSEAELIAFATSALPGDTSFQYIWNSVCYGTIYGQRMPINTNHHGACDYTVTVISNLTGCQTTLTKRIVVEDNPEVKFLVDGARFMAPEFQACANTFPHNIGVVPTNLVDFVWSNQVTTDNFDVELPANNFCIFTVTVTDVYGCKNVDSLGVRALPLLDSTVYVNLCDALNTPYLGKTYTYDPVNPENNIDTVVRVYTSVQNGCDSTVTYIVTLSNKPSVESLVDFTQYYCDGTTLAASVDASMEVNMNGGIPVSIGWDVILPEGGVSPFNIANPITYAFNGYRIYGYAHNSCGVTTTDTFTLHIDATPIVGELRGDALFCVGNEITDVLAAPAVQCRSHEDCTASWQIAATEDGEYADFSGELTAAQNGYYVRYKVTNDCGTAYSDAIQITVDQVPALQISDLTLCAGEELTLDGLHFVATTSATAPALDTVITFGQNTIEDGAVVKYADNNTSLYVTVTNRCGTTESDVVTITVNDKPALNDVLVATALCAGDYAVTIPSIEWHGAKGDSIVEYQLAGTTTWTELAIEDIKDIDLTFHGATLRYTATNTCGTATTSVILSVYDAPEVTLAAYNDVVCEGSALTLPEEGLSVNWNNNEPSSSTFTIFSEDFSNGLSAWMNVDNDNDGYAWVTEVDGIYYNNTSFDANFYHSSPYSAVSGSYTNCTYTPLSPDNWLISPAITIPATGATLSWWTANVQDSYPEHLEVMISTDGTDPADFTSILDATLTGQDWVQASVNLDAYANQTVHFAFVNNETYDEFLMMIDDIELTTSFESVATYQIRTEADGEWTNWTNGSVLDYSDYVEIRYYAQNSCGADSASIMIQMEELPTLELTAGSKVQTLCAGDPIAEITYKSNKDIVLVPVTAGAPALTITDGVISGIADAVVNPGSDPTVYRYAVNTVEGNCGYLTDTITITMSSEPEIIAFSVTNNPMCVGETVVFTSSTNYYGSATSAQVDIKRAGSNEWVSVSELFPAQTQYEATVNDNEAVVRYIATNTCGADTAFVTLHVATPVEIGSIVAVDTCAGEALSTFVPAPVYVANQYSEVRSYGWNVNGESVYNGNTAIDANATVYYFVETQCGTYTSNTVNVTVHDAPVITVTNPGILTICSGEEFVAPTYTVNNNGATQVSAVWTITPVDGTEETLDFDATYDDTYDGATIKLTVTNTCGTDVETFTATVHSLPVPQISKDTTICHDGTTTLTVDNYNATSSYQWFNGNDEMITTNADATATINAADLAAEDATYTYYVVETDANGCASVANENVSYQPIASDVVTIKVTNNPRFIFKYQGAETHIIDGIQTNNGNTEYTWQVFNPCYNEDTLVYVTFDIYHNGELIPDAQLGQYLMPQNINAHQYWYTSDQMDWLNEDLYGMHYTTYYQYAQAGVANDYANHYPNSSLSYGSSTFDDLYLHFLGDREIGKTIRPFLQSGEYKIVYTLWETSNVDRFGYLYDNNDGNGDRYIGGYNAMIQSAIRDILVVDSIIINVEGENGLPVVETPNVAPQSFGNASEPSVRIYPNPAVNEVNAEVKGIAGNTTVQVVNLAGKVVAEEVVNIPANVTYKYTRTVNEFTPGVYFIYFKNEAVTLSKKMVVTK